MNSLDKTSQKNNLFLFWKDLQPYYPQWNGWKENPCVLKSKGWLYTGPSCDLITNCLFLCMSPLPVVLTPVSRLPLAIFIHLCILSSRAFPILFSLLPLFCSVPTFITCTLSSISRLSPFIPCWCLLCGIELKITPVPACGGITVCCVYVDRYQWLSLWLWLPVTLCSCLSLA